MFAASLVKDLDFAPTGGESARKTLDRMAAFVGEIKEKHLEETVLLAGHGGSLRSLILAVMDLPPEATWKFVMANCSLTIIDTYWDNAVLRLYNDTSHLTQLGQSRRYGCRQRERRYRSCPGLTRGAAASVVAIGTAGCPNRTPVSIGD